jgi:TRAP-type C4-dicarboxylate transport system substrate-binding protein
VPPRLVAALGVLCVTGVVGATTEALAQERRIATLAPEGSAWMKILDRGARELAEATSGRVTVKFYAGGSQGDERDVVRKMNLGTLDGAVMTSVGLSLIYPGVRVMELPFLFENVEEIDYVRQKMWPHFAEKFAERGFELVLPGDVGWTYIYSNAALDSLATIQRAKLWAWQDDPIVRALFRRLGIPGVPLGVPDVLPALKSDRIDGCYGSPLAAVALQWYTEVSHATSMPVAYAIGAMVVKKDVWSQASAQDRKAEAAINAGMGKRLVDRIRVDNRRALDAMVKAGIVIVTTPPEFAREFEAEARKTWTDLEGKLYTTEELEMVLGYRDELRARRKRR